MTKITLHPRTRCGIVMLLLFAALPLFITLTVSSAVTVETSKPVLIAGVSPEEALQRGEKMYVNGILPSGGPMQAIVQGDIPVEGSKFTCANCHQRSGFGSSEGTLRTPPIDGTRLYSPYSNFKGIPSKRQRMAQRADTVYRQAYTDETLARIIRTGEDPMGRQLLETMPKYFLNDRDMEILVYYLKNLATGMQPGVTDIGLHFATVMTDEVSREDREAMLGPLRAFIDHWRISKNMERMTRRDSYVQEGSSTGLRKLSLSVWDLKGPAETWRRQLEEYYKKDPVFALLGGITTGEWAPIHRFSEDHKIPTIFPITDFPVISKTDRYTVYLSKGFYQEGETAAKYLHGRDCLSKDKSIVQVFRNDRAGLVLSKAFQETWQGLGHAAPDNVEVDRSDQLTAQFWKRVSALHEHAVIVIWLNAKDFPSLDSLVKAQTGAEMIFASSSLLGQRVYSLPEKERSFVYITYPYTLPQESQKFKSSIETELRTNNIPITNLEIEYKMFSLFSTMTGPFAMMRSYIYRDYFLEVIESSPDMMMNPVTYPRLSFGAGQRYASKGCYVVQLSSGSTPTLIPRSEWVIH